MLNLIAMFVLGVVFAGCLMALFVIHRTFAEDDEIREMEKWYKDAYGEDDEQ